MARRYFIVFNVESLNRPNRLNQPLSVIAIHRLDKMKSDCTFEEYRSIHNIVKYILPNIFLDNVDTINKYYRPKGHDYAEFSDPSVARHFNIISPQIKRGIYIKAN